MKLALVKSSGLSVLNLAISGLMLMTFMTIHLLQFRFGDTDQFGPYFSKPPTFLINFLGILTLDLLIQTHSLVLQATNINIFAFKITTAGRRTSSVERATTWQIASPTVVSG